MGCGATSSGWTTDCCATTGCGVIDVVTSGALLLFLL